jgi:hypothetical protein
MFSVECPHCHLIVWIEQINCRIFRHAVYKENDEPIPPHSSQEECERLVAEDKVWGCAKPFRLNDNNEPEICGYI